MGSTVLRYTSADQDIVANGFTYSCGGFTGPYFDRKDQKGKIHWKGGTEADTLSFVVVPGSSQIFGVSWQTAVKYGYLDGVTVMMEKVFMSTFGDTRAGTVRYFVGRMTTIDMGRSMLVLNAASFLELLNLQLPRNVYQSACRNNLGDFACGVNIQPGGPYSFAATVQAGSNSAFINANITTTWTGNAFNWGKVIIWSGPMTGLQATIGYVNQGSPTSLIALLTPFPSAPTTGTALQMIYGCDKTLGADGCPKFNNTLRYRAERLIPLPATVT